MLTVISIEEACTNAIEQSLLNEIIPQAFQNKVKLFNAQIE